MLFTRCPHCDTIFRVTDQALAKASGRVRCGRCANVFDATADLRESPDGATIARAPDASTAAGVTAAAGGATPAADAGTAKPAGADAAGGTKTAERRRESGEARSNPAHDADAQHARSREQATARATAAANRAAAATETTTITPAEIDEVLASAQADATQEGPVELEIATLRPRSGSNWWRAAAAVALVALGAQAVHYFRHDLVVKPVVGPLLARSYGAFGVELRPRWSVKQYQILDSAATATTDGSGTWKVRARFVNNGPLAQPYPLIHLELKNRWQETVRSRRFTADEYLPRELPRDRLMTSGESAQAALEILDPGPDVSGFELDVCIEVETNVISCGKDEPFL